MASVATQGTILAVSTNGGASFISLCQISSISGPDGSAGEIDVTTLCSTAKEYIIGLPDYGSISLTGVYDPSNTGLTTLKSLFDGQNEADFKITLTDNSATELTFDAYVSAYSWDLQPDDAVRVNITLRVTGAVTVN